MEHCIICVGPNPLNFIKFSKCLSLVPSPNVDHIQLFKDHHTRSNSCQLFLSFIFIIWTMLPSSQVSIKKFDFFFGVLAMPSAEICLNTLLHNHSFF